MKRCEGKKEEKKGVEGKKNLKDEFHNPKQRQLGS